MFYFDGYFCLIPVQSYCTAKLQNREYGIQGTLSHSQRGPLSEHVPCFDLRRASAARFTIMGLTNEDMRTTRFGAPTWMLLILPCVPLVFVLDALLIFTSVAPLFSTQLTTNFSSFMSNYNFTRFFVQYVTESVPQMILQTFIFYRLKQEGVIYFRAATAIYASLAVTGLNVLKFSWKLWKVSDNDKEAPSFR